MNRLVLLVTFGFILLGVGCTAVGSSGPTPTVPVPDAQAVTVDDLRARLESDAPITRADAVAQLERMASPEAIAALGEFFMTSDTSERFDAARALIRLNVPASLDYIRTAMTDDKLTSRRQLAMQALEADGATSYPYLQTLLRDENEIVRLNTIQVIQFIGTAQARTLLQVALKDRSSAVKQAAADALVGLGYSASVSPTP